MSAAVSAATCCGLTSHQAHLQANVDVVSSCSCFAGVWIQKQQHPPAFPAFITMGDGHDGSNAVVVVEAAVVVISFDFADCSAPCARVQKRHQKTDHKTSYLLQKDPGLPSFRTGRYR